MLGKVVTFFVVVAALIIGLHESISSGSMLRFLDEHPHPKLVPATAYTIGQTLYIFHNLDDAATYFYRIEHTYPNSSYADDAAWGRIQCLDDLGGLARPQLVELYQGYLERFPQGQHAEIARSRSEAYGSGAR